MKFKTLALVTAMAFTSTVFADSAPPAIGTLPSIDLPDGFTGQIGATTDAVFRGISFTSEDPVAFANLQYNENMFYLGVSAYAGKDSGIVDTAAATAYGGIHFDVWSAKTPMYVQVQRYFYDENVDHDMDFWEGEIGISQLFKKGEIGASFAYAPDYFDIDDASTIQGYAEYNDVDLPFGNLTQDWTLGVSVGSTDSDIDDYEFWKLYFGKRYSNGVGLQLSYHNTNNVDVVPDNISDERVVASLSYKF